MNEINRDELKQLRNDRSQLIVLVYTNMCGTCKNAILMLNIVSKTLNTFSYYQINANLHQKIIEDYQITGIPCFLVFKNGQLIEKFYAFHSVTFLFQKLQGYEL